MKNLGPFIVLVIIVVILFFGKMMFSQSGCMSRVTGGAAKLPVPENMVKVINFGKNETKKYISYLDSSGKMRIKEYSDTGFFEAEYVLDGATFNTDLTVKEKEIKK